MAAMSSSSSSSSSAPSSVNDSNKIVDIHPFRTRQKIVPRLPVVIKLEEFPPDLNQALRRQQATFRILKIASRRLIEPPTLHLLGLTAWATMGIASVEAILLCQEWPWWESMEAGRFVWWYSLHQLIPSVVWATQDATLVAKSLELDPVTLLRDLSSDDPTAATNLLRLQLMATIRYFAAGFMMIASIVRAAGVSAEAFALYEEQIRMGREPPLPIRTDPDVTPGVVIRFCGRDSFTTEVSLDRMGVHILPIFERPDRVRSMVWKHSENMHRPVYWCVQEHKYGSTFSWDRFPTEESIFFDPWVASDSRLPLSSLGDEKMKLRKKILILEADATNPHDPLALGNAALDLNLDDASQGFRRLQERFSKAHPGDPKPFRTLRVYLGNSLEVARTGGGHSYTLRHRVRYAKEIDVLIDSRAPVLEQILEWCQRVAGADRRIMFQTSSVEYFKSLQKILRCYGYEIYDPLDLRALWLYKTKHYRVKDQSFGEPNGNVAKQEASSDRSNDVPPSLPELLMDDPVLHDIAQRHGMAGVLSMLGGSLDDMKESSKVDENKDVHYHHDSDMLRHVASMAHMPRLVHMPTTAETVNAVEALITAGEVDATYCCAILERQSGVAALEYILEQKSGLVPGERYQEWIQYDSYGQTASVAPTTNADEESSSISSNDQQNDETAGLNRWGEARRKRAGGGAGLQMICTSSIYDDLFRQVRIWARMGYTNAQIQREVDTRFHKVLDYSVEAQGEQVLAESLGTATEVTPDRRSNGPPPN